MCGTETRLLKKITPLVLKTLDSTNAISVKNECLLTLISAQNDSLNDFTATKISQIRIFLENPDQNLKFIGLQLIAKLVDPKCQTAIGLGSDKLEDILLSIIASNFDQAIRSQVVYLLCKIVRLVFFIIHHDFLD
jgi:hypothetical protein